ncbi:P22 phage major capsid protein family protein [Streptomyces sp. NPDC059002]|uniref:P22 phage major capsid protein family protein n=1 Tax=Streptomyces sp. NPDC059002 TaxID=3346690 RepID=UPI003684C22B
MSHTFQIDDVVVSAVELLYHQNVLGNTVHRQVEPGFEGGRGDSVRVRLPKRRTAKDYTGTTQYVDVEENAVQVKLTDEPTDATKLTSKEKTLDVADFAKQVILPQTESVSRYIEKNLAKLMNDESAKVTEAAQIIDPAAKPGAVGHVIKSLTFSAAEFTRREIDPANRFFAIGPDVLQLLLDVEQIQKVNEAGGPEALRNATLGNLFGFDIVVSPHITGAVAYHKDAFALANVALASVEGANSASSSFNEYGLRIVRDFDPSTKSEVCIVDSLCGSKVIDEQRFIPFKVKGAAESAPQAAPGAKPAHPTKRR